MASVPPSAFSNVTNVPVSVSVIRMGSTSQELLCLRWEEFVPHYSDSLRKMRKVSTEEDAESAFFDVSLVVSSSGDEGEEQVLRAHKLILSTCSPLFRSLLSGRALRLSPHPVIYLRGVSAKNLAHILDFIYQGEVNVAQDDLDAFLATAEELKIKGLSQQV